jgi:hypothetical protein
MAIVLYARLRKDGRGIESCDELDVLRDCDMGLWEIVPISSSDKQTNPTY